MTTLQLIGVLFGFAGMLLVRHWLDQDRKTLVLAIVVVLTMTAPLWPLTYLGSLGLYVLLQIARLLIAWRRNIPYDIPGWANRLV